MLCLLYTYRELGLHRLRKDSKQHHKKTRKGVPSIEQYTRTDKKRTESVLHSLSSFLDKHCICRHKCSIKLEVIC